MKSTIFMLLAQLIVLADSTLLPVFRESLRRNPTPLLFFIYDVCPPLIIGLLLSLSIVSNNKRKYWIVLSIFEIIVNVVLLISHFAGLISVSSLLYPYLFVGLSLGMIIGRSTNKTQKKIE